MIELTQVQNDMMMANAVIANHGRRSYDDAVSEFKRQYDMTTEEAKRIIDTESKKYYDQLSTYGQSMLNLHQIIYFDMILDHIGPGYYQSIIPNAVPQNKYLRYQQHVVNRIALEYVSNVTDEKDLTQNESQILTMIYTNQLESFFDRFFTQKETAICSHDKTVFVIAQLERAILTQTVLPLVEYFNNDKPDLSGKRTYWSTSTFQTTNDVKSFLTTQFYLSNS